MIKFLATILLFVSSQSLYANVLDVQIATTSAFTTTVGEGQLSPDNPALLPNWFKMNYVAINVSGEPVTIQNIGVETLSFEGKRFYHEIDILFPVTVLPGDFYSEIFYIGGLAESESLVYLGQIQLSGWHGTLELPTDSLDVKNHFLVD